MSVSVGVGVGVGVGAGLVLIQTHRGELLRPLLTPPLRLLKLLPERFQLAVTLLIRARARGWGWG